MCSGVISFSSFQTGARLAQKSARGAGWDGLRGGCGFRSVRGGSGQDFANSSWASLNFAGAGRKQTKIQAAQHSVVETRQH